FPYVETRDQLSAIDDVKSDMERPAPMDRLICGDVGFGKTEIAIRAAFKAVLDGKQVAVLVPTTLLAQQHYATFTERFAPFPVTLEMAMGGIRDMSVIDTPPEDRHPVLTFVGAGNDETIARAIRREMLREGQTFYVHNFVQDIDRTAGHIRKLVPDARVGV